MSTCTWRYAVIVTPEDNFLPEGPNELFQICEEYPNLGNTGAVAPAGNSLEELKNDLEMMLRDISREDVKIIYATEDKCA